MLMFILFDQGFFERQEATQVGQAFTYMALPTEEINNGWYLDNGATHHVTNNLNNLQIKSEFKRGEKLIVGNCKTLARAHIGSALNIPNCKEIHSWLNWIIQ